MVDLKETLKRLCSNIDTDYSNFDTDFRHCRYSFEASSERNSTFPRRLPSVFVPRWGCFWLRVCIRSVKFTEKQWEAINNRLKLPREARLLIEGNASLYKFHGNHAGFPTRSAALAELKTMAHFAKCLSAVFENMGARSWYALIDTAKNSDWRSMREIWLARQEMINEIAADMRHSKRWNDVEELLDAGIDVYTTLNVQHIESLSDVVAGTTGIWVKETVPDSVFDTAEDIILVDINVDELIKRLHEGKVYIAPEVRARALENFFRTRNLIALREIALRRTAERVDEQMHALTPWQGTNDSLPVADKVMVCIGPDPLSAQLVRTAKRMATSLKAPWVAVYVENLRHYRLDKYGHQATQQVARMAERIGGRSATIQGDHVVDEIIAYAKANRITKIIIGKPIKPVSIPEKK